MSWSVVGTPAASVVSATDVSVNVPAGHASGDLILFYCHGTNPVTYITGEPSGYTRLASSTGTGTDNIWAIFAKVATGSSEDAPTCTWASSTGNKAGQIIVLQDNNGVMDLGSIVGDPDKTDGYNSGNISYPACTVADANSIVLLWGVVAKNNDTGDYTLGAVSGFEQVAAGERIDAYGKAVALYHQIQTTATNISAGTITVTGDTAAGTELGHIMYLKSTASTKYLKLLAHPSAASATGVEGWVIGDDNTTYYGYFSGQAFESELDGVQAELLVPVADISPDGATLTTSDTPQVATRNALTGTTMCDATVVEE